ncbi:MAG: hypothetical protein RL033_6022, partial [Pseudomonadota bacterium]
MGGEVDRNTQRVDAGHDTASQIAEQGIRREPLDAEDTRLADREGIGEQP